MLGTAVEVIGGRTFDSNTSLIAPTWECLVDGAHKDTGVFWTSTKTAQSRLCFISGLTAGEHQLQLNVVSESTSTTNLEDEFSLDYIIYTPFEGAVFGDTNQVILWNDSAVQYVAHWDYFSSDLEDGHAAANAQGASLYVKFNGEVFCTSFRIVLMYFARFLDTSSGECHQYR